MSIKGKIRVAGKYIGAEDSIIIGGVEFVKGQLTDTFVTFEQYTDLANSSWFEISTNGGSGEAVPGPQGPKGDPGEKGEKVTQAFKDQKESRVLLVPKVKRAIQVFKDLKANLVQMGQMVLKEKKVTQVLKVLTVNL